MAGAKGKSGGARKGAGAKPKKPVLLQVQATDDPEEFLAAVMNDRKIDAKLRMEAARSLMPYRHKRIGDKGKKEEQAEKAERAAGGKFKRSAPPKLAVVRNA